MGLYGRYDVGDVRMTGVVAHAKTRYDSERRIAYGHGDDMVNRTAAGRFDGNEWVASIRGQVTRSTAGGTLHSAGSQRQRTQTVLRGYRPAACTAGAAPSAATHGA